MARPLTRTTPVFSIGLVRSIPTCLSAAVFAKLDRSKGPCQLTAPKIPVRQNGGSEEAPMALEIDWVIIDCIDLEAMSDFWWPGARLRARVDRAFRRYLLAAKDGSHLRLGLMPCQDGKTAKNRLHLDLRPDDQEAEVRRLEDLGAQRIDIGQCGVPWVVMADPEGNEFCVLRSRSQEQLARHNRKTDYVIPKRRRDGTLTGLSSSASINARPV